MNRFERLTLAPGVAVSLILHACIVLPIFFWVWNAPHRPVRKMNRLDVEIHKMPSSRQIAAPLKRIESAPPTTAESEQKLAEAKPEVAPRETPLTMPHIQQIEPSTDTSNVVRLPQTAASPHTESSAGAARAQVGNVEQQPHQIISAHNDMNDRIAAYMVQLTKRLQSNLIYPQEAKKKKIEGTSEVSFVITESGDVRQNTLAVKRSSGNAALDAAAMHTVVSSSPFLKPPRELSVSVELAFEVDRRIF